MTYAKRDPKGHEATRDPIFILLTARRQILALPDFVETDGESWWIAPEVDDGINRSIWDLVDDWVKECTDDDPDDPRALDVSRLIEAMEGRTFGDNDTPYWQWVWSPERVFLTRGEGERWANARSYRWEKWKVYCVCCEGELSEILNREDSYV